MNEQGIYPCFGNYLLKFGFCLIVSCPEDYVPFLGRCYTMFETGSNFSKAEVTCNAEGGHLASYHSDEVYAYLVMLTM